VDYVSQGLDAVAAVDKAMGEGKGYGVIFLDMRMPPGIDGKETARLIRERDGSANIVMVTGFSDHSPQAVAKAAPPVDKLFYLSKPFEAGEILQLAEALSARWVQDAELREARAELETQMVALEGANIQLAASEARAVNAALTDGLTGIANRTALVAALARRLSDPKAEASVLFIDLDRFKSVNDTLGHHAGDELVKHVSRELERLLPSGSLLARMGGDEFGVLIPSSDPGVLAAVADRIVQACAQPITLMGNTVQTGASVGIVSRDERGASAIDLLRRADLALYAAKNEGRGRWRLYDASLDESASARGKIEAGLRQALAEDRLSLLYQPIIDQADGRVSGFEALVRWHRPEGDIVPPSVFIPIAEESDLITDIGDWITRKAMADCATWDGPYISINLSPRQFRRHDLVGFMVGEAGRAGIETSRVQLEITETSLFENIVQAAEVLSGLRAAGFRVALDDFGTGYASLVYLRNFEIDCIKIDGSFVADMGGDNQSSAIISAIANLARTLGMSVVAEGVEDVYQQQALRLSGCGYLQGYLLGRPMPLQQVSALLSDEQRPPQEDRAADPRPPLPVLQATG